MTTAEKAKAGAGVSKRNDLLDAMETLLWERGYESTSPRLVLDRSGAGQGSLYHHFSGKRELALEAMEQHEAVLIAEADRVLGASELDPLERICRWLEAPRNPMKGCRLGRLVHEKSVREDDELRRPVDRYFERLHTALSDLLAEALPARDGENMIEPDTLASMLVAVVQGGFVVSQGTGDPEHMERALGAASAMLRRYRSDFSCRTAESDRYGLASGS